MLCFFCCASFCALGLPTKNSVLFRLVPLRFSGTVEAIAWPATPHRLASSCGAESAAAKEAKKKTHRKIAFRADRLGDFCNSVPPSPVAPPPRLLPGHGFTQGANTLVQAAKALVQEAHNKKFQPGEINSEHRKKRERYA